MNTTVPGVIRPTDLDGEADPAIEPIPVGIPLVTETGIPLITDLGEQLLVTVTPSQ